MFADNVRNMLGRGAILRVPKDGSNAGIVHLAHDTNLCPKGSRSAKKPECECQIPVEDVVVQELLRETRQDKAVKIFEREDTSGRAGWQSLGLDGENADFYTLMM